MDSPTTDVGWLRRGDIHWQSGDLYGAMDAYARAWQMGKQARAGDDWLMGVARHYFAVAGQLGITPRPITEARQMDRHEKRIESIKHVRQRTGWGLKASKEFVGSIDALSTMARALPSFGAEATGIFKPSTTAGVFEQMNWLSELGKYCQDIIDLPAPTECAARECRILKPAAHVYCEEHTARDGRQWSAYDATRTGVVQPSPPVKAMDEILSALRWHGVAAQPTNVLPDAPVEGK